MDLTSTIALSLGAAWASGINLYAAIFMIGWLGSTGYMELPPELMLATDPLVLTAAGVMYCIEFFADKIPGVDSFWDALHTFIRIPAGAAMAFAATGNMDPAVQLAALLVGGTVATTSHVTKTGVRLMINTSPEPVTNWTASISEDMAVLGGLWVALNYPLAFLAALVLFILIAAWLLPKIWRLIKGLVQKIAGFFSAKANPS